jgi:hypothetical protein
MEDLQLWDGNWYVTTLFKEGVMIVPGATITPSTTSFIVHSIIHSINPSIIQNIISTLNPSVYSVAIFTQRRRSLLE